MANKRRKVTRALKPAEPRRPLLDLMLLALAELYPLDATTPGVCVAYIPKEQAFYASVVRYESSLERKQILTSHKAPTLIEAITGLGHAWFNANENALHLREQVRRGKA